MQRILVTGGAGFIGSHVVDALVARGDQVTVIDNLTTGKKKYISPQARFIRGSITKRASLRQVFAHEKFRSKFDCVVHLAAQKNARQSVIDPVFDAQQNILGSIYVLEAARKHGVRRFVFSSTGGVMYGEAKRVPTPETEPVDPLSPYAIAKRSVEQYLHYYNKVHGISTIALRLGNIYGPRQDPRGEAGVVAIFMNALLSGQPVKIFGKGTQTRDYVYIDDCVKAIILAIDTRATGQYNIGAGKQTTVNALYKKIQKITGTKRKYKNNRQFPAKYIKAISGEQQISALNSNLAKKILGWKSKTTLTEGLIKTHAWFIKDI